MKTALELLGHVGQLDETGDSTGCEAPGCKVCDPDRDTGRLLELVAERAREEMREAAARTAIDAGADGVYDASADAATRRIEAAIRALPVKPGGTDADHIPPDRLRAALVQAISDMPPDSSSGQIADAVLARFELRLRR